MHEKGGKMAFNFNRHRDFQRIYDEFCNYYKNRAKGETEYYDWLRALKIDESKPYGWARESFTWAKDMLRPLKEDTENKYYAVTVGLPWRSMNGNIYKERDLIAAALSLDGKHPSLNHKNEFWFKEGNPWGTLTTKGGKYEDGAVETILQVPKTAVCPICNGAKMTELIDNKRIVNVSLEGSMEGAFEFTDPPFTLLTTDILPGIPLARIKPLEHIMVEALQVSTKNIGETRKMTKIVAKIKEDLTETRVVVDAPTGNAPVGVDRRDNTRGTFGTPVTSDNALASNTASSGNTTVRMGESPANVVMKSGSPMQDKQEACVCEPFADYKNFDDCVAKNSDKEDPAAYCGSVKAKTENVTGPLKGYTDAGPDRTKPPERSTPEAGSLPSSDDQTVVMGTSPASSRVVMGSAPVEKLVAEERVKRIKAEYAAEGLEKNLKYVESVWTEKYLKLDEELQEAKKSTMQLESVVKELRTSKADLETKFDSANEKHNKELVETRMELEDFKGRYGNATRESSKFSGLVTDLQKDNEDLKSKYHGALKLNLELSKKNTEANEDYLNLARDNEKLKEELGRTKVLAKKITRITA